MSLMPYINHVIEGQDLRLSEMVEASQLVFNDLTELDEIKQFLIALDQKGETVEEIAGLASVMRANAVQIEVPNGLYIDNCGTGGDGIQSFNVSTTAAFVIAGAGLKVAKHGNRKVSSLAGSSDVLEALGIHLFTNVEETASLLEKEGIAFLHAPNMHPKLGRIGEVRRAIGKPTIFNLVGPLTNPVPLKTQFVGISRPHFTTEYAEVLHLLDRKRAIVVSAENGMDEASLAGNNSFVLLDHGDIVPFKLSAEDVGLKSQPISAIRGGNATENAVILRELLDGKQSPYFDTVIFNAGIALFAYGLVDKMKDGIELARESIFSGKAKSKLEAVISYSEFKKEAGAR